VRLQMGLFLCFPTHSAPPPRQCNCLATPPVPNRPSMLPTITTAACLYICSHFTQKPSRNLVDSILESRVSPLSKMLSNSKQVPTKLQITRTAISTPLPSARTTLAAAEVKCDPYSCRGQMCSPFHPTFPAKPR
jgi:hypothetical protein